MLKRILVGAIALVESTTAAVAVTLEGLEFDTARLVPGETAVYTITKDMRNSHWVGVFDDGAFLLTRATGRNKVWQMTSAPQGQRLYENDEGIVRSNLVLFELDCAEGRQKVVSAQEFDSYMGEGNILFRGDHDGEWVYVQPGTVATYTQEIGCGLLRKH